MVPNTARPSLKTAMEVKLAGMRISAGSVGSLRGWTTRLAARR